jgi:hypothetical protein
LTALIVTTVALGIVLIASGVLHILRERGFRNIRSQRDRLNEENESLHQINTLISNALANVHAQLADRNEALQEAQAEIKALNMRTIEMSEVTSDVPLSYAETKPIIERAAQITPPKRPQRGKKAGEP